MLSKSTTTLMTACACAAVLSAGSALAQDRPDIHRPVPDNSRLPGLSAIRPLPPGAASAPIHNIEVTVEQGYAHAVNVDQPTELDQKSLQTTVGISADLGDYLFAGITGTYSHEDITSTNLAFAMPIAGDANVLGVNGVLGVRPVEFMELGVLAGYGKGDASYEFTGFPFPIPPTPADTATRRLGAFLTGFYAYDRLMLSATAAVVNLHTTVDYGPGNIPATDTSGATILLGKIGAAYSLTDKLTVAGGVTVNHVLSQDIPAAETGLDSTWLTVEGGLEYAITSQFSVHAKAATWLLNDRMDFTRIAVGATYKF